MCYVIGSVMEVEDYLQLQKRTLALIGPGDASRDFYADYLLSYLSGLSSAGAGSSLVKTANDSSSDTDTLVFIPVDTKVPPVFIRTRRRDELLHQRILVALDDWSAQSVFPWGHFVLALGADGDKAVETQVLLHEFGVSHEAFSNDVMACLPSADWKISPEVVAQRRDLRHLPVVSIDPPGCKDIDDALHCMRLPNGNIQVGVHIAGWFNITCMLNMLFNCHLCECRCYLLRAS